MEDRNKVDPPMSSLSLQEQIAISIAPLSIVIFGIIMPMGQLARWW